ncbi:hypothetical protein BaRGS_00028010, partial [Batillaria attramentaria]
MAHLLLLVAFENYHEASDQIRRFTKPQAVGDYPFRNVSLPWDERVADIVKRLTLEEMQGQMGRGGAGSVGGPAPAIERLGIGPYEFDTECLRGDASAPGPATSFPQALGLAASFSPSLIFRMAEATGVEVRGKHNDFVKQGIYGFHTGASCFSPVINIMRDPRWGRNQKHTERTLTCQGNDTRYVRASGGCKHFDAHSGPDSIPVSRFSFDAKVSEYDWRMTFLPAFRTCVEAGTYNLMCTYNRYRIILDSRVSAILECYFPAQGTGDAIRHVLLNDVDGAVPAGRLPNTWPLLESQIPPMVNYSMEGRTYRYTDPSSAPPLYPFGYGLSYTNFSYTATLTADTIHAGEPLKGEVTVKNTGNLAADEVIQVYIRWMDDTLPAPRLQLAWFDRVTVHPQSPVTVPFEVEARSMELWINDGWRITPGVMEVYVGCFVMFHCLFAGLMEVYV